MSSENDDRNVTGSDPIDNGGSLVPELSEFDALLNSAIANPVPDASMPAASNAKPTSATQSLEPARAVPFDFSDRPELSIPTSGPADWLALVLAVALPPVGLLASIVVRIVSYTRNGWTSRVARAATIVGVIMTLVAGGGLFVASSIAQSEAAEQARVAESVPLCAALNETPGVLDEPAFGWPNEVVALPATLDMMKAYQSHWAELATIAPSDQTSAARSIAVAAQTLVSAVESTKSIDRQRNLEQMTQITGQTGLNEWYSQYCS